MKLVTEPYLNQASKWPKIGRHILAQFDENLVTRENGLLISRIFPNSFSNSANIKEADRTQLLTPCETVYPVIDPDSFQRLGLSSVS